MFSNIGCHGCCLPSLLASRSVIFLPVHDKTRIEFSNSVRCTSSKSVTEYVDSRVSYVLDRSVYSSWNSDTCKTFVKGSTDIRRYPPRRLLETEQRCFYYVAQSPASTGSGISVSLAKNVKKWRRDSLESIDADRFWEGPASISTTGSDLQGQYPEFVPWQFYRHFVKSFRRKIRKVLLCLHRRRFRKNECLKVKDAFLGSRCNGDTVFMPIKRYWWAFFSSKLALSQYWHILESVSLERQRISSWFQHMSAMYGESLILLVVLSYWIQGFRCFPWLAISYHFKDVLQVNPNTLQFMQSTANLPMVAKPVYGIISDAVCIRGAHRMPYLIIASFLQVFSWSIIVINPWVRSSIGIMMAVLVLSNVGAAIAEVVNDALVAEFNLKGRDHSKGNLQCFAWSALAIGGIVGNLFGGVALSRMELRTMFTIFLGLVSIQLIACSLIKEKSFGIKISPEPLKVIKGKGEVVGADLYRCMGLIKQQFGTLIQLVRRSEIFGPLAWFAASCALVPTLGGSMFYYHTQCLKIDPTFLGLAKVVGQLGLLAGSISYSVLLRNCPLRMLVVLVQVLLSFCTLSDILLVTRMNLKVGVPDEMFVLGTSAFVEALGQFKVLPFTVLLTQLCPAGSEGSLLAFFMSSQCLASILSGYLGVFLADLLQISVDNFSALPMAILIQSTIVLVPLLWITCIPKLPGM